MNCSQWIIQRKRALQVGLAVLLLSALIGCGERPSGEQASGTPTITPTPVITEDTLVIESESALVDGSEMVDGKHHIRASEQYKKVLFSGDWTVRDVVIDSPMWVRFSEEVKVESLAFSFDAADTYEIVTANASQSAGITLDTPNAHLLWNGVGGMSFADIEQYQNVLSVNERLTNPRLGGSGSARIEAGSYRGREVVMKGSVLYLGCGYNEFSHLDTKDIEVTLSEGATVTFVYAEGETYATVTDCEDKTFGYRVLPYGGAYGLPRIFLSTEACAPIENTDDYVKGMFSIDYNGTGNYEELCYEPMKIRGRGFSSWKLDKKPYKVKLENKQSLFGLAEAKTWVLQANMADKSLMRNTVAMAAGKVLDNMVFIPDSYLVDVFLNGDYIGVYSLTQQVEIAEGRVPGEPNGTELDIDYLLEIGGEKTEFEWGSNIISSKLIHYTEIRNPDTKHVTKDQYAFIKDYVNTMDKTVMDGGDYEALLDIPSVIDWFLLDEFSYNVDCTFHRSGILLKKAGGKIFMAVPWDFDYAFGNISWDSEEYDEWICLGNDITDTYKDGAKYIKENWMDYFLVDPAFIEQLKARWDEVGEAMYSAALAEIDAQEKLAAASADENFARWKGILGKKIQFEDKRSAKIATWTGQLDYLRDFCTMRYNWMDNKINEMYEEYCN